MRTKLAYAGRYTIWFTHKSFRSECSVAWRLKNHHGAVHVDNGDGGDGAELLAKLLGLGRDDVTVLVRLACKPRTSD